MLRYAITAGSGQSARELAAAARRWGQDGVDFVQLREPTLPANELLAAATAMAAAIRSAGAQTRLLLNARADIAIAAGADGVHLTARPGELTPNQVRTLFAQAQLLEATVSISCHTLEEVVRARDAAADLILFGPVFEKRVGGEAVLEGVGLDRLHEACMAAPKTRVLALGGVTQRNAALCLQAGAAGVAAIRMFAAAGPFFPEV